MTHAEKRLIEEMAHALLVLLADKPDIRNRVKEALAVVTRARESRELA